MKDDLTSPQNLPFNRLAETVDFGKFEDDLSELEMVNFEQKQVKFDLELVYPLLVTVATLTPGQPSPKIGSGLSFLDAGAVNCITFDEGNGTINGGSVRFSNDPAGEKQLTPTVYVYYPDSFTGVYLVKLYVQLRDSGPFDFNLISQNKAKTRRLFGPGNKVITLTIKNPEHIFCCLQQLPRDNEHKPEWYFYKAVIGRGLLSPVIKP